MKRVKEGEDGDVFSTPALIWNTEACRSHFKKGEGEEGE
jgi:hypothetical protein